MVKKRFPAEVTFNPSSSNPTNWSNILKQFVGNLPTNCLSVLDHLWSWRLNGQLIVPISQIPTLQSKLFSFI